MTNRFMMSVAAVALIAGAGFANAQGTGPKEQPSAGSTAQQSAPSSERGNSAAPSNPSSDMKATQSEEKSPGAAKSKRAQDDMKAGQKSEKSAQDNLKGEKSKSMSSETQTNEKGPAAKDMKAEGRDTKMNAEQKGAADSKSTTTQSQTTGQAGASAKLSTEQRTRITSVIREQHVQPLNNVSFSIAVGTRVPRDVRFYPLPREVVTIYPEWRGYEFVLVNNQIIVVDPRTFEIVAILEA
jgi:cytoskeletal protein RodZ